MLVISGKTSNPSGWCRTDPPESPVTSPAQRPRTSVQGTLQQVDCLVKIARLRVATGQKQVLLALADPQTVTVKGSPTGTIDLTCGPQKGKLVVLEYEARPDARLGTTGIVRSIEFK
ncbi:MAG: hypothetical protein DMG57_26140 [Acidobacteria bacterium]|nr:MAG: hypothetical protein DMG57_26140 [Acidobacteriota bacterium]